VAYITAKFFRYRLGVIASVIDTARNVNHKEKIWLTLILRLEAQKSAKQ
jgi:hypothetical protein